MPEDDIDNEEFLTPEEELEEILAERRYKEKRRKKLKENIIFIMSIITAISTSILAGIQVWSLCRLIDSLNNIVLPI